MTEFTPNDEQVENAYALFSRNAFIASTNEHREEFKRWLVKHDRRIRAEERKLISWERNGALLTPEDQNRTFHSQLDLDV